MPTIVAEIDGGSLQAVYTDYNDADVIVADQDITEEGQPPSTERLPPEQIHPLGDLPGEIDIPEPTQEDRDEFEEDEENEEQQVNEDTSPQQTTGGGETQTVGDILREGGGSLPV